MQAVTLDETSALAMRRFYEEELDKTVRKLEHIKQVLDQLGGSSVKMDMSIVKSAISTATATTTNLYKGAEAPAAAVATSAAEAPVAKAPASAEAEAVAQPTKRKNAGKRRGPKAVWESLVLKRLRQLDRPVTYEQLTDEIMVFAQLPPSKRLNTKRAIVNVAFKLRNRDHKIDTFSNGSREKYIALRSWFEESGKIKKEYASKIEA